MSNATGLRKTGIDIISNACWGTHFCQFYQTKKDLADVLVPYFKAGLENNEFCMWVTSGQFSADDARAALRKNMPDFDEYEKKGQIEILPYTKWYFKDGRFQPKAVLSGCVKKMEKALAKGYAGLRISGDTLWLKRKHWRPFKDYEEKANRLIRNYRMIAACTYSLERFDASDVIDVANTHQFALIKRQNKWELVQSSEHKIDEEKIKWLSMLPEENPSPVLRISREGVLLYANKASVGLLNLWKSGGDGVVPDEVRKSVRQCIRTRVNKELEVTTENAVYSLILVPFPDVGYVNVYGKDISKRKDSEDRLRKMNRALKALSKTSHAMMYSSDESEFLDKICRIIIDDCGYKMVWIGYAEQNKEKSVKPAAYCGFDESYIQKARITWANNDRGRGPTGTAIRTGKISMCKNMVDDPHFTPWRKNALKLGYQSSLAVPLKSGPVVIGALSLYSEEKNGFSYEEIELLSELAEDLSFGITAFRVREQHRLSEEALRLSALRFRLALRNVPVSVAIQDLNLRFLWYYNQESVSSSDEIIGRTDTDLFEPDDAARLIILKRNVIDSGKEIRNQMWITRKGKRLFLDIYLEPLKDLEGRVTALGTATIDITERKEMEDKLEAAEEILTRDKETLKKLVYEQADEVIRTRMELEKENRLADMGRMASTIAHELRNPLAAIKTAAYNIRRKTVGTHLDKHIENIDRKVSESDSIIKNVLNFSRMKIANFEPLKLCDIINDCLNNVRGKYAVREISVSEKYNCQTGCIVEADRSMLASLFSNVLDNAFQALSDKKGNIDISVSEKDRDSYEISIQDDGIGIEEENIHKIYDPFYTTKARGTGLGLTVCKEIAALHAGKLEISSVRGKGTTVTILLPHRRPQEVQWKKDS